MSPPDADAHPVDLIAVASAAEAAEAAAERLAAIIQQARRPALSPVTVVLSGGTTPIAAYRTLGERVPDWHGIAIFLADERCVPFNHQESNARVIVEALGPDRGYELHGLPAIGSPADRARAYAHELTDRRLNVVLLGLGEDGHTASLFPHHGALDADGTTVAVLDSPKPPPERVTLTLPALAGADELLLLVTGSGKADALRRALSNPDPATPASLLRRDRLTVIADADALRDAREAGLVDRSA